MIKTTIDKNFFKRWKDKDVVMRCRKKEHADEFCRLLHENGYTWNDGSDPLDNSRFLDNTRWTDADICYNFNVGLCGRIKYYDYCNYIILEFEDFIIPDNEPKFICHQWFNYFKDKKVAMHCQKEDDADLFCYLMDMCGLTPHGEESYIDNSHWGGEYEEYTAYFFEYGLVDDVRELGKYCKILEFENYKNRIRSKSFYADNRPYLYEVVVSSVNMEYLED